MSPRPEVPPRTSAAGDTSPPGPQTGYSHSGCYAQALVDCGPRISREHYISRALLNKMGGPFDLAGAPFQAPGSLRGLNTEALAAKVLCERHNSSLTALDDEAARLFQAVRTVDAGLRNGERPTSETMVVNGADLERWLLKVMAGMTYGGLFSGARRLRAETPWLEVLFGRSTWPAGWGLTVQRGTSHAFEGVEVGNYLVGDELWAGWVDVGGLRLQINLGRPGDVTTFRPAGVVFGRPDAAVAKRLVFAWPEPLSSDFVRALRVGQYDGPRPEDQKLKREP